MLALVGCHLLACESPLYHVVARHVPDMAILIQLRPVLANDQVLCKLPGFT